MNLRKIIREEISRIFQEQDAAGDTSVLGGALTGIDTELTTDLDNINNIVKTHTIDLKNKDNQIKANNQLKSKLDAATPQRKGLEREIPEDQKDYEKRKKQLKDLQDAKDGIEKAKSEIEKQKVELQNQTLNTQTGTKQSNTSVLPSLQSPI